MEIFSFLKLETNNYKEFHKDAIALNSGRNCFRYIIKAHNIKEIYLPKYTCECIFDIAKEENVEYKTYSIDNKFLPEEEFKKDAYILYTNYFGICTKNIEKLAKKYKNLIIDNAHGFYSPLNKGLASFNSIRKFFGVPDGAYLNCKIKLNDNFKKDISYKRSLYLLKANETGYNEVLRDFELAECTIELNKEIKLLSDLTKNLLSNVNYKKCAKIRRENFEIYNKELKDNLLKFEIKNDVPMAYPYLSDDDNLREYLISKKIYTEKYFENSNDIKRNIIPLPIHQQITKAEIKNIISIIKQRKYL